MKKDLLAAAVKALSASGAHRFTPARYRGLGAILMLHRVQPEAADDAGFAPNRELSVTPDFLSRAIDIVRGEGLECVSLDEGLDRLRRGTGQRFCVFTLDDGYRDNLDYAYPVFAAARVPFTIFIPSAWPAGFGQSHTPDLWWLVFEQVIRSRDMFEPGLDGLPRLMRTDSPREKLSAFQRLDRYFAGRPECERRAFTTNLAARHGIDLDALARATLMTWDEIAGLASSDLVTIGSHGVTHANMMRLPDAELDAELSRSREKIEARLGRPCRHFAFPYGDASATGDRVFAAAQRAGYDGAVTTTNRPLYREDRERMFALPRINLSGARQDAASLLLQLRGLPHALRLALKLPRVG
ncbi:MAG: polysaccharide deacetylase family protein [Hyphomicrobiaceae bacterium]|nr:polysaccharide deacetylase family protein [Hyphomicrobiaceae bacterium]